MTNKQSRLKKHRVFIVIASLLIALVAIGMATLLVAISRQSLTTSTLEHVTHVNKSAATLFGPALNTLGIPGQPEIVSSCWLDVGARMTCHSSTIYPSNLKTILTDGQIADFKTNASNLDNLLKAEGWVAGKGDQSFSALTPDIFNAQSGVATQNASYRLDFGKRPNDDDFCILMISLTNPGGAAQSKGAVLNVISFVCREAVGS